MSPTWATTKLYRFFCHPREEVHSNMHIYKTGQKRQSHVRAIPASSPVASSPPSSSSPHSGQAEAQLWPGDPARLPRLGQSTVVQKPEAAAAEASTVFPALRFTSPSPRATESAGRENRGGQICLRAQGVIGGVQGRMEEGGSNVSFSRRPSDPLLAILTS